jgi:hydrogenase-4 component E
MIDTLLVAVVLLAIALLGTSDLGAAVRATAAQGFILALMPLAIGAGVSWHVVLIAGITIAIKAFGVPAMVLRAMRRAGVNREIEPLLGFGPSVLGGGAIVALSFGLGSRLELPGDPISPLLVPCGISTFLLGLLILVARTKALTQVLGYLVLENGVYIMGLAIVRELPIVVELGILLDVFVGVFIMGIVIWRISRTFDHIDTHAMTALRD